MKTAGYLIILITISLLLVLVYVAAEQPVSGAGEWAGGDELLQRQVEETTGGEYKPWFEPLWEPPSCEIETFLFSLQAAIGAIFIGYFIGYYKGKKEVTWK